MIGVLIKKGNLGTDSHTEGRQCEETQEDGCPQATERGLEQTPAPDFRPPASSAVGEHISLVLSPPVCGTMLQQLQETCRSYIHKGAGSRGPAGMTTQKPAPQSPSPPPPRTAQRSQRILPPSPKSRASESSPPPYGKAEGIKGAGRWTKGGNLNQSLRNSVIPARKRPSSTKLATQYSVFIFLSVHKLCAGRDSGQDKALPWKTQSLFATPLAS